MAGGKKKKKPAANPARGYATTSIASKKKVEGPDSDTGPTLADDREEDVPAQSMGSTAAVHSEDALPKVQPQALTAEEFEQQLEESELQVLVDRHAQKSKRDAIRQKGRLETDRRVLRGQAESLSSRKWLPQELMEEILDLIKGEGRFAGQPSDMSNTSKQLSEEDLTVRLWTLQQSLIGAGFMEEDVVMAIRYVLDISDRVTAGAKDAIWGLDEALDWLARERSKDQLPDYEKWQRRAGNISKFQPGWIPERVIACID